MNHLDVVLVDKIERTPHTFEFTFQFAENTEFNFKPGQYVWLLLENPLFEGSKEQRRAFSIISSAQQKKTFSIIVREGDSIYKKTLFSLAIGAPAQIRGPHGSAFTLDNITNQPYVFIAGGVGISPFLSILRSLDMYEQSPKITLINININADRAIFIDEITVLCQKHGVNFVNVVQPYSSKDISQEFIDTNSFYFISGHLTFVESINNMLLDSKIPSENIIFEQFYPHETSDMAAIFSNAQEIQNEKVEIIQENLNEKMVLYISILGIFAPILILLFYATKNVLFMQMIPSFLTIGVMFFSLVLLKVYRKLNFAIYLITGYLTINILFGLFTGRLGALGLYWLYFLPLIYFFFFRKIKGLLITLSYFGIIAGIFTLSYLKVITYQYDFISIFNSLLSLAVVIALSFLFSYLSGLEEKQLGIWNMLEKNFRLAIENSTNHTIMTDLNGYIVFANEAAQKTTGFTFDEMKGNTPRLWGGLHDKAFYKKLWTTIKVEKKSFIGEVMNIRKNGETYVAFARISPVENEGRLIGYVATEEDISDRKKLENALSQKLTELTKANNLMVDRELKMIELKKKIEVLENSTLK